MDPVTKHTRRRTGGKALLCMEQLTQIQDTYSKNWLAEAKSMHGLSFYLDMEPLKQITEAQTADVKKITKT